MSAPFGRHDIHGRMLLYEIAVGQTWSGRWPRIKFHVGEIVSLRPVVSRNVPGGAYEVTKQLPHNGREFEYRIKSASEEHERVALESELTKA